MALPGAAQCGRNPSHGALAGDGAGGADHCCAGHSLDGAGAWTGIFTLALLAADGVLRACGGGDVAGALPAAVDQRFSFGGARGGHRVAGADRNVRASTGRPLFSLLCVRDGGGRLSLGTMGDGGHRMCRRGIAVGGSAGGANWTGTRGGSVAADGGVAAQCECAGPESATVGHVFGIPAGAWISAWLHGGEPEKSTGGARRDHARSQFAP